MDKLSLALALSKSIELSVTEYGINHNHFREGNPVIQDRSSRIIINTVYAAGSVILYEQLKKEKPKLAKGLAIGIIVAHGAMVAHNLRKMK